MNNVSLAKVSDCASQIRVLNAELDDTLTSIANTMCELNKFDSQCAKTLTAKFNFFANKVAAGHETIDDYCKFLELVVRSYEDIKAQ